MPEVNARARSLRTGSCVVALLLLSAAAALPAAQASDTDLLGNLEGILDAELAACDDIKKMTDLDQLARAKALVSVVKEPSERDLAAYHKLERELREAREHLKKLEDELAGRLSKVRLEARSAIEYEQGKVDGLLAQAKPIDEAIAKLEGEIAGLNKFINEQLAKIAKMSWIDQQTAKQPADEQTRVKALTDELKAKRQELEPIAQELAPHKQALDDLKAKLQAAEQKVEAEFRARLAGARAEVARLQVQFDGFAKKLADARAGAVAPQLQRPGLLECIAAREDELLKEGLGTAGTSATTGAVTVGGEQPEPPHAPGSQPFSSAGLEGKTWTGSWEVTCKQGGQPDERKNGVGEFRFAGDKVSILLKRLFVEDPAQADEPIDMPLDELGAFAVDIKEQYLEWGLRGQFQLATAADGSPKPTGRGDHKLVLDLSFLSGMVTAFATLGADAGTEISPEEREKATSRCNGTWELP
jgi:peptidoglycan hydrolase CwlO-like protein